MNTKRIDLPTWIRWHEGDIILGIFFLIVFIGIAFARDGGDYSGVAPNIRQWFQSLMQPDNPAVSCCGEADAFEADDFERDGDHYVAIITDGKGSIPNGTRIPVPNSKMKWDSGNPTGHGIIFLGYGPGPFSKTLYCYVAPGGA